VAKENTDVPQPEIRVTPSDIRGAADVAEVEIPETLPVLPLKNNVLFPFTAAPLSVGEKTSLAAVEEALASHKMLAVMAVKQTTNQEKTSGSGDKYSPEIYSLGTAVSIFRFLKMPDETVRLLTQGLKKIRITNIIQTTPFMKAEVEAVEESYQKTDRIEALMRALIERVARMTNMVSYLPEELQVTAMNVEDPLLLVYLVATLFRMEISDKQAILESDNLEDKYNRTLSHLNREIELLELGGKIQSQVKSEMDKSQREYFLRQQLKAIKEELGEADETQAQITELMNQLADKDLPEEVRKEADRELKRLEHIHTASPEYQVIRTYLEWIIDLPWKEATEDNLDLKRARQVLDEDHYDLKEIKERIVEYLAVRKRKQDMKGPILCFVGPPGVGKTSLGQSIARALGRKFIRMSLGGMRDEAEIRGHRRTYIGALPGRIIQSIRRAESNNPVFMLDEIDKVGADFRGDPSSALLEVLDPEQNHSFRDHYLDLAFDLSRVLFITTANVLQTIHPALRDRMEVLTLSGYTTEEKVHIADRYLVPRQIKENGLTEDKIGITEKALVHIIEAYTKEAGVRNLEREIARICRKVAYNMELGEAAKKVTIKPDDLAEYLGPEKQFPEVAKRTSIPGVATGLAWTESGGDILFIEAITMPGNNNLILTGQLGDVMQESAKAALSYVRSRAGELGLKGDPFKNTDIHLHVPAGAIPKDGPSAGITMATAIASVLSGRPVTNDVAMTGEITLTGQVLPIGGIKGKVLAAKRAGIKKVILPKRNETELEELETEVKNGLKFILVDNIKEVLDVALLNGGSATAARSKKNTAPAETG